MNGRGSSGGGGRSVILGEDSSDQDNNGNGPLAVTNGILGGEKLRTLPSAFISLTPIMRESFLTKEYVSVAREEEKLSGLYVLPSFQSCDLWFGVIFVRNGPYQGGVFRFTLKFPKDFPTTSALPILTFQPPIFHPSIHPSRGVFDLNQRTFKQGWNYKCHNVSQVLRAMRTSFYKVEATSCVNKQAHDLLENDFTQYNSRCQKEVEASLLPKRLYEECPPEYNKDIHWIKFSQSDNSSREPFHVKMKSGGPSQSSNVLTEVFSRSGLQKGQGMMSQSVSMPNFK